MEKLHTQNLHKSAMAINIRYKNEVGPGPLRRGDLGQIAPPAPLTPYLGGPAEDDVVTIIY
jgi:hypothetical protein